jgi:acetyl-CoA acetyltransferase
MSLQALAATLRCDELRFGLEIGSGGGSGAGLIDTAKVLVTSGAASVVLCHRTIVGNDWVVRMNMPDEVRPYYMDVVNYLRPVGWTGYLHTFACMYAQHAARYGTTREALGHVVGQLRANAARNPNAACAEPLSLEEYLSHPPQIGPFSGLDDFAIADVAAAVIVTTAEHARALGLRGPVAEIVATAQTHNDHPMTWFENRALVATEESPTRHVADKLYEHSGLTPQDIDVAHLYDCTSFTFLHNLEEARLCERGEAAGLVAESGSLAADGRRPANTNGGDLAGGYSHGFRHVLEAARQVTGRAHNQVANAEMALVMGAQLGPTSGAILRRREIF